MALVMENMKLVACVAEPVFRNLLRKKEKVMPRSRKTPCIDYRGERFGRLTVLSKVDGTRASWLCECDCGNKKILLASRLKRIKSCGCLEAENRKKFRERICKHNASNTILYSKWCGMKERCYNPNNPRYESYGKRGIKICDEWLGDNGFLNFFKWAYDNGYDDNLVGYQQTIDRIDVDGNYEPSNCRWISQREQVKNRRNSRLILDLDGSSLTYVEFCKKHNIESEMFVYRCIHKGFDAKRILDEWDSYCECNNGDYYTIDDAVKYYDVQPNTIIMWIKRGYIKAKKVRRKYYINKGQERPMFNNRNRNGTFKKK